MLPSAPFPSTAVGGRKRASTDDGRRRDAEPYLYPSIVYIGPTFFCSGLMESKSSARGGSVARGRGRGARGGGRARSIASDAAAASVSEEGERAVWYQAATTLYEQKENHEERTVEGVTLLTANHPPSVCTWRLQEARHIEVIKASLKSGVLSMPSFSAILNTTSQAPVIIPS